MSNLFGSEGYSMWFSLVDWEDTVNFEKLRTDRVNRVREVLRKNNLDGIVTFRGQNVRYLTSFRWLWWPTDFSDRQAAILTEDGALVLFCPSGDYERANKTMSWMKGNIKPMPSCVDSAVAKMFISGEFKRSMVEVGLTKGRVGVDASSFVIIDALEKELANVEFVDGEKVMQEAKLIKTSEEIKLMRISCVISDIGIQAAIESSVTGRTECEVQAEAFRAMFARGAETTQCTGIVASGTHTAPLNRMATDKPIRHGDLVLIDLGACFNGYFTEGARTVIVGDANARQKEMYRAVYESMEAIVETVRPGATSMEVNDAARLIFKERFGEHGYFGVLGHGIGAAPVEPPLIGDVSTTGTSVFKYEPGMIHSYEPGLFIPEVGGVRLENEILVTEKGCEVLNRLPYDKKLLE
jgi:Xaa-Pro aminopeptidase